MPAAENDAPHVAEADTQPVALSAMPSDEVPVSNSRLVVVVPLRTVMIAEKPSSAPADDPPGTLELWDCHDARGCQCRALHAPAADQQPS